MLLLAMSRSLYLEAPNKDYFSQHRAFKVIFCPQGLDYSVKLFLMEPRFNHGAFLHNAKIFLMNWFIQGKEELEVAIYACSSIWLVGIVNQDGEWFHQILEAVIYTYSGPPEQSSFIEYIAVQESSHDKNVETETAPLQKQGWNQPQNGSGSEHAQQSCARACLYEELR
jgi:hypothetical protein